MGRKRDEVKRRVLSYMRERAEEEGGQFRSRVWWLCDLVGDYCSDATVLAAVRELLEEKSPYFVVAAYGLSESVGKTMVVEYTTAEYRWAEEAERAKKLAAWEARREQEALHLRELARHMERIKRVLQIFNVDVAMDKGFDDKTLRIQSRTPRDMDALATLMERALR
jgi:hypothetical protein